MMSLPTLRNVFLSAVFVAALAAGSASIPMPEPPPTPPASDAPIVQNSTECEPVLAINGGHWTKKIMDYRRDMGIPIRPSPKLAQAADDHTLDMINRGYIGIPTIDNPPKTLRQQVEPLFAAGNNIVDIKTIILVGCWTDRDSPNEIWQVIQADPVLRAIANRPDWTHVGAYVNHPDGGKANPAPGVLKQNYWQAIFIKNVLD